MSLEGIVKSVELLWADDEFPGYGPREGFFWHYRNGKFDPHRAARAIEVLRSIRPDEFGDALPREVVRLLWWIPRILEWNRERVADGGADIEAVEATIGAIEEEMNRILGVP